MPRASIQAAPGYPAVEEAPDAMSTGRQGPLSSSLRPLAREVDRLGRLLGDVIREQEGEEAFGLVETYRAATKAMRAVEERPDDFGEAGGELLARTSGLGD